MKTAGTSSSNQQGYANAEYSPTGEHFFVEELGQNALTMSGITLYDARTRKPGLKLEMDTIAYEYWNGAISADGKRFVAYYQFKDKPNECRVWNLATGKQESTFKTMKGFNCRMAVSPDGKRLVTIDDHLTAKVWDLDTGLELLNIPSRFSVYLVTFHPDGTRIALSHAGMDILVLDGTPLLEGKK